MEGAHDTQGAFEEFMEGVVSRHGIHGQFRSTVVEDGTAAWLQEQAAARKRMQYAQAWWTAVDTATRGGAF
jgi:hypothetical protein